MRWSGSMRASQDLLGRDGGLRLDTGLNYRYGTMPFAVGQKVRLVKEPDNQADREAIRAELPGLGKVGYVANSTHTVKGDC